ncbi:MAG TPA: hypothetical protein VF462_12500 [Micromonosporaceae bacterium]
MIPVVLATAGVVLILAGPVLIVQGLAGRRSITHELASQKIAFPSGAGLPGGLSRYAGSPVRTGTQAKAYSDLIARHVDKATGGRTYAEIADEWLAGGRKDERLTRLREMAFMGQTLRGALLGAYQAWQITALVTALGVLVATIGVAFLAMALHWA